MKPHILLILNFLVLIITLWSQDSVGSHNPKFTACQPKTCVNNNQTISYPFYIEGIQEPFCGYPGFGLSCNKDGFPFLNMSHSQYIIHEIFYNNHSLRVSNAAFSRLNTTTCLPRTQNLTLSGTRLALSPNQKDMFLFFGCEFEWSQLQERKIGCSAENGTGSVVALYREDQNLRSALMKCKGGVVNMTVESEKGGIQEALRRGFMMTWKVSDCNKCMNSGGKCGFDTEIYSFRCYCRHDTHARKCSSEESGKPVVILATVSAAAGFGLLVIIIIYCYRRKLLCRFWKEKSRVNQDFETFLRNYGPIAVRRYSYMEIKKMTNAFKEKLGQGGYGSVFKGKLEDGSLVAVKVLSELKGNGEEFINEVASISKTSHVNVVTLIGFCSEESKKALVYEYMANGSLEKFIYETNNLTADYQLNCEMLYQIAIGVGRGLEYLHRGCNTRIFHFDIKPHNILLDEMFCPKISDFGLAKICPRNESVVSMLVARGTIGYIAPEVFCRNIGVVSYKSDVYSFGMLVLEMVGGRKNINVEVECTSEIYFPYWIYKRIELNEELSLRNVMNESDRDNIKKMILVSLWCIQTNPSDRPTMHRVVEMLEGNVETLQVPPKPFLSSPSLSPHSSPSH
ncbi:hypothetical protein Lal_00025438 [Lupinus albus]|uniref:non-specific serine/threonine protein kinase n=1 Tax=Lupinus albus TaxID=3870 RepID=A0A6A5NYL2_LUPAL|nr:putative glycerophosphodiester phosphodiesterase, protein kinase RLK-Pelle-LRK10L-2 family [Lupinus albus]KAF1890105.1 hypothetical protein Lal_00025438 [Lupinus albus]